MKVALVFQSLGIGGVERVGVEYARLFQDLGHDVTIYNLTPGTEEMLPAFPKGCHFFQKYVPEVLLPHRYLNGVKRWWWGKYAYPILFPITSILLYLYRFTMGKRREYDLTIAFSGHFRDLTFVAGNFIKGKKKMAWLHGSLMDYMLSSSSYGALYRKLKNICTLSSTGQSSVLLRNTYLKDLNIHQIYNPIHLHTQEVDQNVVTHLKNTYGDFLLMVGRFDTDKDQKTVIRSYHLLHTLYGIENPLLFVGDGPTLLECKQEAETLHLSHKIFFLGTRKDVGNFYAAGKLFIHSSPQEGLPTVLLEAMKYQMPIVATDSPPGVAEILGKDQYGLTCKVGDPVDLAEKVYLMMTNSETYHDYQERGQKRIVDFSYETIQKQLTEILSTLK